MNHPRLVIINGYPGSGKTTLAKRLADEIPGLPVLRKDALKEWMYDEFGESRLSSEILGRMAAEMLHTAAIQISATGNSLLIESAFYPEFTRPIFEELVVKYGLEVIEIYMMVDPQTAHDRLRERMNQGERHAVHDKDAQVGEVFDGSWTEKYGVLGVGRLERYDAVEFSETEYQRTKDTIKTFLDL